MIHEKKAPTDNIMSEGAFNYVAIFCKSYTAAKSGIFTLTHVLVVSFAGKIRVNSISPG